MPANTTTESVPLGSFRDTPNQITAARLVATVFCFACLSMGWYGAGLVLFLLAAGTDWADGYWARRWGPITRLGRVLDPVADKLLICGVFVYLAAIPDTDVEPWMAVVVLGRELLVTALRSFVESGGGDFSAKWLGKWKMVAQCVAVSLSLLQAAGWVDVPGPWLAWDPDAITVVDYAIWASLAFTVWSGIDYMLLTHTTIRAADQVEAAE